MFVIGLPTSSGQWANRRRVCSSICRYTVLASVKALDGILLHLFTGL